MPKVLKHFLILLCLVLILILPYFVFAQSPTAMLENTQTTSGYAVADAYSVSTLAGKVIAIFLGMLGVIFITLMLYGGFNWMIAAGDEAKLTRAKDTIRRAIIGLVIVVSSYAIWIFIFKAIS